MSGNTIIINWWPSVDSIDQLMDEYDGSCGAYFNLNDHRWVNCNVDPDLWRYIGDGQWENNDGTKIAKFLINPTHLGDEKIDFDKVLIKGVEPIEFIAVSISLSKECTCGAKHTSNPSHHLSYCDLKENK